MVCSKQGTYTSVHCQQLQSKLLSIRWETTASTPQLGTTPQVRLCRRYNYACVTYPASCKTTSNASWNSCARHGPNLQAILVMWVWEEDLVKQTAKAGPTPQPNGSVWMILKLRKQTSKLAALSTAVLLHQAINLRLQTVASLSKSKASASANAAAYHQG